jgi:hypothetical protein
MQPIMGGMYLRHIWFPRQSERVICAQSTRFSSTVKGPKDKWDYALMPRSVAGIREMQAANSRLKASPQRSAETARYADSAA